MRKAISIAVAVLLGASTFPAPADAQVGSATGSCGWQTGSYGLNNLDVDDPRNPNDPENTVPTAFFEVNYSGLAGAPTTVGVIIRYEDELEEQIGQPISFTADATQGTFRSALRSSTEPSAQGGGDTLFVGESGRTATNKGRSERTSARRAGRSSSPSPNTGQFRGSAGGLGPGLYAFYIYTGEMRNMPETVKDGPAGVRFIADERGLLGKFMCGIEDD